jgi:hypothetical protein
MIKTAVLKLLTVKVVIAACATTAAGGVALAASTGNLPNPLDKHGSGGSSQIGTAPDSEKSKSSHGGGRDDGKDKDGKNNDNGNGKQGNADASHAPSPSLVGLCHAYDSGNKADHGKALDNPAFTVLITTAGGRDKVDAFCIALLANPNAGNDNGNGNGNGNDNGKKAKPDPTTSPGGNGNGNSNGNGNGNGNSNGK